MNNAKFLEKWKWYIFTFDALAALINFFIAAQTKNLTYTFLGLGFLSLLIASFLHPTSPHIELSEFSKKKGTVNFASLGLFIIALAMFSIALAIYFFN